MVVVSLINQKGGCGKTTTAVNLSCALAKTGTRVLLIDLDPQAHATYSLGISTQKTSADLFERTINNVSFNIKEFFIQRSQNLTVIASSIGLSAMEQVLANRDDKLDIAGRLLKQVGSDFDYCIIDCPPSLGILTLNALLVSSYAIVPIGICELSLKGVENLNNILSMFQSYKRSTPALHYLITQLDKRFKFSQSFLKKVQEQLGKRLLSTNIRTNIHLREAASCGMSIFEYKKDSRGAEDYASLAQEVRRSTRSASWVEFLFKGTEYKEVYVVGEFNNWKRSEQYKLKKLNTGTWALNMPFKKGTYRYKFVADDNWMCDPANERTESDSYGGKNSVLRVA